MKTKKCGVYAALAAVLLISAVLITNCVDPLNGLSVPKEEQPRFTPPPGMGYIVLDFGDSGSPLRTIRPNTATLFPDISIFTRFDLLITDLDLEGSPPAPSTTLTRTGQTYSQMIAPFTLPGGSYDIEVWAYNGGGTPGTKSTALAYGISTAKSIIGSGDTATIVLSEIANNIIGGGSGVGIFKLALTNATTNPATGITMNVFPLPNGGAVVTDENILSRLMTYEENMAPGYYRVEITLTRANSLTTTIREILHIYQGMTSTYTATLPQVNHNEYTITYTFNDSRTGGSTPATEDETVVHGNAILGPESSDTDGIPTHISGDSNYSFLGWFTTASGSPTNVEREIGLYKPLADETLQARWTYTSTGNLTLTLTLSMSGPNDPQLSVSGLTLSGSNGVYTGTISRPSAPTTITFSVTNNSAYASYEWTVSTSAATSSTSSIDLDFSDFDYLLSGDHVITVIGTTSGGSYYSSTATIKVSP